MATQMEMKFDYGDIPRFRIFTPGTGGASDLLTLGINENGITSRDLDETSALYWDRAARTLTIYRTDGTAAIVLDASEVPAGKTARIRLVGGCESKEAYALVTEVM